MVDIKADNGELQGVARSWEDVSQELGRIHANASDETQLKRSSYSGLIVGDLQCCDSSDTLSSVSDAFETLRNRVLDLLGEGASVTQKLSGSVTGAAGGLDQAETDATETFEGGGGFSPPSSSLPETSTPDPTDTGLPLQPVNTSPEVAVEPLDPDSLDDDQRTAYDNSFYRDDAAGGTVDSYDDLFFQNDATDTLTSPDQPVIDVKHVVNPETGAEHWIVSVPSDTGCTDLPGPVDDPSSDTTGAPAGYSPTERSDDHAFDWAAMDDAPPSSNDPQLPGSTGQQLDHSAVVQAMHDAGIPDGANVLLTGTGQGGYLAASLASTPDLPHHCIGVVTAGTPIGETNIPADIPVISFEHPADPFTQTDLNGNGVVDQPTASNYTQVVLPDDGTGTFDQHNYPDAVASYLQTDPTMAQSHSEWFGHIQSHEMYTWTTSSETDTSTTAGISVD